MEPRPQNRVSAHEGVELEQLDPTALVEHLSVPAFLRRTPHRWNIDDMRRFGDKVGQMAEAMHLGFHTTLNLSLGTLRIFPVPMMERIYEVLAVQYHWAPLVNEPALEDSPQEQREALRGHERLEKHLRTVMELAESAEVQAGCGVVIGWIEAEIARLRVELGETATTGE